MPSVASLLKSKTMQQLWKKTEAATKSGNLPDGDYIGLIEDYEIGLSKSDKLQIVWHLRVLDGDFEGRQQYKFSGLSTDKQIAFAKRDLASIGLDASVALDEIGAQIELVLNKPMQFVVRTNGEFTNIDFVDLVVEGAAPAADSTGEVDDGANEGVSAESVRGMDEDELTALIAEVDLTIDPDEYETWEEVAEEIVKQLELE